MTKIQALTKGGEPLELDGEEHGPFLVHESPNEASVALEDIPMWRVTHTASGVRFPFDFLTKEAAIAFSQEVEPLHDWQAAQCGRDESGSVQAKWTAAQPTTEQKQVIKRVARERGGISPTA